MGCLHGAASKGVVRGASPSLPHFSLQVLSPCEGGYSLCFGRFVPKAATVQNQAPGLDNDSYHAPRYLGR